jgi:fatty-acid peroxygenase
VSFAREGYTFISRRCEKLGTDGFRTRLALRPVTCIRGADAAEFFYGDQRFSRSRAFPKSVQHLLQDEGSVQALDGEAHRLRKEMFLHALHGQAPEDIADAFEREWRAAIPHWQRAEETVLHEAVERLLTRTAMSWAGVPVTERSVRRRAREFSAMIGEAGSIGPVNWWARWLRNRCERWAQRLVTAVRGGHIHPPEGSALAIVATHRGGSGEEIDTAVAAVELINVLRPIVAVGRFVTFAALALLEHPQWQETFAAGEERDLVGFVHEVRRVYPFFPLVAGTVREPVRWHGHAFSAGDWIMLDLYGTNHDPRLWTRPEVFDPRRFRDWVGDPNTLIPQGGGRYEDNHRCPGEQATIALMARAVQLLTQTTRYGVGVQDFSVSLRRMPTLPKDGFVIRDVRPVA